MRSGVSAVPRGKKTYKLARCEQRAGTRGRRLTDGWPSGKQKTAAIRLGRTTTDKTGRSASIPGEFVTDRRGRLSSPRGASVDRIILFIGGAAGCTNCSSSRRRSWTDGKYNERRQTVYGRLGGRHGRRRLDRRSMCQPEASATRRPLPAHLHRRDNWPSEHGSNVANQLDLTDRRLTACLQVFYRNDLSRRRPPACADVKSECEGF